jgi:hypothetical protein
MFRRPAPAFVVLVVLVLAASTGCAAGHDQQPGGRSVSPEGVAPSTSAPVVTAPPTTPASPPSPGDVAPPNPPSSGSGIAGRLVIDGGCPVIQADSPCPDRPVRAHLSILDAVTGKVAASVDTDAGGGFVVSLKPGRYLLRTDQMSGAPPHRPTPATVTVQPGRYTTVTIRFDSGIR